MNNPPTFDALLACRLGRAVPRPTGTHRPFWAAALMRRKIRSRAAAENLRRSGFAGPSILMLSGGGGQRPPEPKKKDTQSVSFFLNCPPTLDTALRNPSAGIIFNFPVPQP